MIAPDGEAIRPIAGRFENWAPLVTAGGGEAALQYSGDWRPVGSLRYLPPVERTARVVVAGANYSKHLEEFGLARPAQPFAFLKAYGALIGAYDHISYPALTSELDHEVELVAVIGAERIDRTDPLAGILGYTVGNDVSARDLQRSGPAGIGMDLFAAKSQDGSTPVGPWIVTRDEFPAGPPRLKMTLRVDGDVRQDGSTSQMTWDVAELIAFVDVHSCFSCGDILFTGTPDGVGQGSGRFLNPGEIVEASIEGIGTLRNPVGGRPV